MSVRDRRNDQRQKVLEVAGALFSERGFEQVSMTEIATEAGVARASVFNYFGSKHAMIEAITETVLEFYREMLDDALADDDTPTPDLVRELCAGMAEGIESQRRLFRAVFREIARIQLGLDVGEVSQRATRDARDRLRVLFARGQARGELTDTLSVDALAAAFHALTNGTITNWLFSEATTSLKQDLADAAGVFLSPVERAQTTSRRKESR